MLQIQHFHENDVWNGSNLNIHNSPATYDFKCFQNQCFNSDNTIIIWQRMLHHPTTLHLIDLKNNHSLMRLANYGCTIKLLCLGTSLILLFFGVFSGNQCRHWIWCQILHEIVFLSQISQISTMVVLYMSPSSFLKLFPMLGKIWPHIFTELSIPKFAWSLLWKILHTYF